MFGFLLVYRDLAAASHLWALFSLFVTQLLYSILARGLNSRSACVFCMLLYGSLERILLLPRILYGEIQQIQHKYPDHGGWGKHLSFSLM